MATLKTSVNDVTKTLEGDVAAAGSRSRARRRRVRLLSRPNQCRSQRLN